MEEKKLKLRNDIKTKLGLIVDKPKVGGSGKSNTRNTARQILTNWKY